jgi:hypothetical protein
MQTGNTQYNWAPIREGDPAIALGWTHEMDSGGDELRTPAVGCARPSIDPEGRDVNAGAWIISQDSSETLYGRFLAKKA